MSHSLRVLLIEDNVDDAELLLRELRRGGYDPQWQRVDTAPALLAALRDREWDVVTCDDVMPQFSALAALKILRESGIGLPVIIVSGQVGEEVAVAAMKAGAHDYVSKRRMTRLVPAIERELAEARERRRAQATVRETEGRYRELVESLHDVVFEIGADERITYISPSVIGLGGAEPAEYVGRPFRAMVYPDDLPLVLDSLQRTVAGAHEPLTFRVVGPRGRVRWVRTSSRPVFAADGTLRAVRGVMTDVTEQLEAEEAYRTIFEGAIHGMVLIQGGRVVMANPAVADITGHPPEAAARPLEALAAELIHREDIDGVRTQLDRWLALGEVPPRWSFRIRRADGTDALLYTQAAVVTHRGAPAALVTVADLTDRWRAEEAYRSVFERSLEGLLVVSGTQVLMANPAAAALTGYPIDELAGIPTPDLLTRLVHPDDRAPLAAELAAYLGGAGQFHRHELRMRRRDGAERRVLTACAPMAFAGRPAVLFSCLDITDRWRAEAALRELNVELEARVAERTAALQSTAQELAAFSASASHDLRAPLRSIDGLCRTVIEDCADRLPAEARAALNRMRATAADMGTLIDRLLALSTVVSGELRRESVDLSALARDAAAEVTRHLPEGRVAVVIEEGLRAEGDVALLRAALDHLLANAVKFSGPRAAARIAVGARAAGDQVVFFVRDNGVGFDPRHADRLFRPFQRLHPASEFAGHGIGLATVWRIVTRHGGRVWAESSPGEGTTFYFTLG